MGDLIGSGFEPHTSRTRSERLTTCCRCKCTVRTFLFLYFYPCW